ncbi:hypothetical protein [Fuchsiella alkaliacetigena]|uniref:hypothetical protein n=1 Tax=Fuchsiella alkaliacetigena TaxID=957042 RepID=UPI00200B8C81|nr:hypothetical protein [Fuchsiella alkaliacetigena]MCK8824678.1 hypothetical protein [Fuchsiella alkaliacetigena]
MLYICGVTVAVLNLAGFYAEPIIPGFLRYLVPSVYVGLLVYTGVISGFEDGLRVFNAYVISLLVLIHIGMLLSENFLPN